MRKFTIAVAVPAADPDAVYDRLKDFANYPQYSATVRSVTMLPDQDGDPVSSWEVDFRGGILRWIETDHFHPELRRIDYRQIQGDLEVFTGTWTVEVAEGSCVVHFVSYFDLGIPTLEDALEPIAEEALFENITAITEGLFGPGTSVLSSGGEPATMADLQPVQA